MQLSRCCHADQARGRPASNLNTSSIIAHNIWKKKIFFLKFRNNLRNIIVFIKMFGCQWTACGEGGMEKHAALHAGTSATDWLEDGVGLDGSVFMCA